MEEYYIGYVFDGLYPPKAAQWCNENGTCHIEANKEGKYEIVENVDREEPEHLFNDNTPSIPELNKKIGSKHDRYIKSFERRKTNGR